MPSNTRGEFPQRLLGQLELPPLPEFVAVLDEFVKAGEDGHEDLVEVEAVEDRRES